MNVQLWLVTQKRLHQPTTAAVFPSTGAVALQPSCRIRNFCERLDLQIQRLGRQLFQISPFSSRRKNSYRELKIRRVTQLVALLRKAARGLFPRTTFAAGDISGRREIRCGFMAYAFGYESGVLGSGAKRASLPVTS